MGRTTATRARHIMLARIGARFVRRAGIGPPMLGPDAVARGAHDARATGLIADEWLPRLRRFGGRLQR